MKLSIPDMSCGHCKASVERTIIDLVDRQEEWRAETRLPRATRWQTREERALLSLLDGEREALINFGGMEELLQELNHLVDGIAVFAQVAVIVALVISFWGKWPTDRVETLLNLIR